MAWELPDWLVDLGGDLWTGVKDYATDPDTIGEWIERYMFENPGLTINELLDLARETNKLNNPNIQNPFGGTQVTYDDDGQGTVSQYMNQGTLDLVNTIGRRLASGEVNTFQTPQGVLDAGTQAIQNQTRHNELQRNSALVEQLQRENPGMSDVDFQNLLMQQGITTAPQDVNWFVGGNREPTTWTDLVNPSGTPTGGTGTQDPNRPTGGNIVERPNDDITRTNEEWLRDLYMTRPDLFDQSTWEDPNKPPWWQDEWGAYPDIDYMNTPLQDQWNEYASQLGSDVGRWLSEYGPGVLEGLAAVTGPVGDLLAIGGQALADAYCAANACTDAEYFSLVKDMQIMLDTHGETLLADLGLGGRDMSDDLGANPDNPYEDTGLADPNPFPDAGGGGSGGGPISGGGGGVGDLFDRLRMGDIPITSPGRGGGWSCHSTPTGVACTPNKQG